MLNTLVPVCILIGDSVLPVLGLVPLDVVDGLRDHLGEMGVWGAPSAEKPGVILDFHSFLCSLGKTHLVTALWAHAF